MNIQKLVSDLQEVKRKIWDEAHTVPSGTILPEGTDIIEVESINPDGGYSEEFKLYRLDSDLRMIEAFVPFIRTLEPLINHDDTGPLELHEQAGCIVLEGVLCGYSHFLSDKQARNLVRKITEALDTRSQVG